MKSLDDMTEPELKAQMELTARAVQASLPPGSAFIVLATTFGKSGAAQYVSNVNKEDAASWMGETLSRWGKGDYIPRVGT